MALGAECARMIEAGGQRLEVAVDVSEERELQRTCLSCSSIAGFSSVDTS